MKTSGGLGDCGVTVPVKSITLSPSFILLKRFQPVRIGYRAGEKIADTQAQNPWRELLNKFQRSSPAIGPCSCKQLL